MLLEAIEKEIEKSFPSLEYTLDENERLISIPAINDDIGSIGIQDDEHEATILIGNFTHSHFGCYEENFTEEQQRSYIADDVIEFLNNMFNDQIIMWGSHAKGGGYYLKGHKSNSKSLFGKQRKEWVWSGPLQS